MKKVDLFILIVLCLMTGLVVGINVTHSFEESQNVKELQMQREQYELELEESRKKQDSLSRKSDSLSHIGTVIVEKIKQIPVYVNVAYDTLGSVKLRDLMIKEYDKRSNR
jgi:sortase (surface protein transpeptidase)